MNNYSTLAEIASDFEQAWVKNQVPDLEQYLERVTAVDQLQLALLLVPIDITFRQRAGIPTLATDYRWLGPEVFELAAKVTAPDDATSGPNGQSDDPSEDVDQFHLAASGGTTRPETLSHFRNSQTIGPYKLLQQIGEGGMGSVWMAQQDKPVRRRVALKLIKAGLDSKQVIARFEAERQALAMMDHQNISKVLDAGTTAEGLPYFVMELVQGIPFNKYCDDNRLSIRERLELFIPICAAVQHAHQKGIIHRDIKPSNVLVTLYDGKPVPKIIDFGLAKALQHQTLLTDKTMFTEFGQVVGTLQYMSPEQAEMNTLDIDTRTDIYSLGVMLYELLTGSTPIERETLRKDAIFKVLQTIRELEPPCPSARLSSSNQQSISSVSEQRRIEPNRLAQILRGDLDWIVMKALDKDRTRRYDSPLDLAADVRRHLQNEPVLARPPSTLYLFRRFVARNRAAVMTSALILIALVGGLFVVSMLWVREADARANADKSAAKSNAVATFLKQMLATVSPSSAQGKDVTLLREILDSTSERLGKDLIAYPDVDVELRMVIGKTYEDISEFQKALDMNLAVLDLRRTKLPQDDVLISRALYGVSCSYERLDKLAEAEAKIRDAIKTREQVPTADPTMFAKFHGHLAWLLFRQDKIAEAEKECEYALSLFDDKHPEAPLIRANNLNALAAVSAKAAMFKKSVDVQRQVVEQVKLINGEMHLRYISSLNNLCQSLLQTGELDEVIQTATHALELQQKMTGKPIGQNSHSLLKAMASVHSIRKEYPQAISLLQQSVAAATEIYGPNHRFTIDKRALLTRTQVAAGRLDDATETLRLARESGGGLSADNSLEVAAAWLAIARQDYETAEREARTEVDRLSKTGALPSIQRARALEALANSQFGKGQLADSVATIREAIANLNPKINQGAPILSGMQTELVQFLRAQRPDDPEATALEAELQAK